MMAPNLADSRHELTKSMIIINVGDAMGELQKSQAYLSYLSAVHLSVPEIDAVKASLIRQPDTVLLSLDVCHCTVFGR